MLGQLRDQAQQPRTLDTSFQQCLEYVEGAPHVWQHRILLVRGPGQLWIWVTPEGEVQAADLSTKRIKPLRRNTPFPPGCVVFDPITEDEIMGYHLDARELASILGFELPAPEAATKKWFVNDPVSPSYGQEIPANVYLNDAILISRESVGIVDIDGVWTQCVRLEGPDPWAGYLRILARAPRTDSRLVGDTRDAEGKRFMSFTDAAIQSRPEEIPGWPLPGARSVKEVLNSMRDAGQTSWDEHHANWISKSGVGPKSAVAREHGMLSVCLRILMQFDQVDLTNIAGCEYLVRRMIQIEAAVKRNPRQPDFEGLDAILDSSVDTSGAALAPKFMEYVSGIQKSQALIYKAGRIWNEEQAALAKASKASGSGSKGGGGGSPG